MEDFTVAEQVKTVEMGRPHLVILGAGASRQAFPLGERSGRKLPLMKDFVEVTDLSSVLGKYGINPEICNFETFYSELCEKGDKPGLISELEATIYSYFLSLELPEEATLYDRLLLALRSKDVIATFNWDPLLFYAAQRNYDNTELPSILHLHGNVAVGYCTKHRIKWTSGSKCSRCGQQLTPTRLLYPVARKNYRADPFLESEWKTFEQALEAAYIVTIFGYSAPTTDLDAMDVMKTAWRRSDERERELKQIEIIDTRAEKELASTWKDFIVRAHYHTIDDFFCSLLALYPRRTCEALWSQLMMLRRLHENQPPRDVPLEVLWNWHEPLVGAERGAKARKGFG